MVPGCSWFFPITREGATNGHHPPCLILPGGTARRVPVSMTGHPSRPPSRHPCGCQFLSGVLPPRAVPLSRHLPGQGVPFSPFRVPGPGGTTPRPGIFRGVRYPVPPPGGVFADRSPGEPVTLPGRVPAPYLSRYSPGAPPHPPVTLPPVPPLRGVIVQGSRVPGRCCSPGGDSVSFRKHPSRNVARLFSRRFAIAPGLLTRVPPGRFPAPVPAGAHPAGVMSRFFPSGLLSSIPGGCSVHHPEGLPPRRGGFRVPVPGVFREGGSREPIAPGPGDAPRHNHHTPGNGAPHRHRRKVSRGKP